jgi:hypothetical protein
MLGLVVYFACLMFFWINAVIFYNSKRSDRSKPEFVDFLIMVLPVFNILGGIVLLIINLRIDEIGFQKILFLNFRNKDKRK